MLDYTIPAFAGFLMVVMIVETSPKWAVTTYFVVSALCLVITPNYEASMLFILFMGYYPILKFYLDQLNNKVFSWSVKYIVFNLAAAVFFSCFSVCVYIC